MFNRVIRLIRSFFNKFLTNAEDPVTILENNIRDMRNQVPKLNEGVARAHGTVFMLEKQEQQYALEENNLRAKLKAAAMSNEDEIGKDIALQLQRTLDQRKKTQLALEQAQAGLKSMEDLRDVQVRKIKSETEKIKDAIEDSKVSKLKGELAELFQTYEVGDLAYSNDEMLEKLNRESATNEGKLAAASSGVDMAQIKVEQKAEAIQADELYKQFKSEMNIDIAPSSKSTSKESTTTKQKVKKTIG
jgi:phage shock protein A